MVADIAWLSKMDVHNLFGLFGHLGVKHIAFDIFALEDHGLGGGYSYL